MENEPNAEPEAETAATPDPMVVIGGLQDELAKAKDDMLRALAEAENTRRRAEKQVQDARAFAIDKFARDLLPVADTLSRALESLSPEVRAGMETTIKTLVEGVEMTERALIDTLSRNNVRRIGTKGEPFDPNLHQAVAQAPADTPANTIAEVMQPGFVLGDRTLRPAMVVVSAGKPAGAAPSDPSPTIDIKV
jgi:molecular chaperone GrpE